MDRDGLDLSLPVLATASEWVSEGERAAITAIETSQSLFEATERRQLLKARIGQGIFRENLTRIESGCRLTGIPEIRVSWWQVI